MATEGRKTNMRVALVEFLNAVPLYYALKKGLIENDFEFVSDVPSQCARLLFENRVDISNASIVEYVNSDKYRLLRDGCISSFGRVKSVVFFLYKPLDKVKLVKLDRNSKTSNVLARVLFHFKYKISVDFTFDGDADCELMIGDRALKNLSRAAETVDLAKEWFELTGLPFVFAAWITNKRLSDDTVQKFLEAKEIGKTLVKQICDEYSHVIGKEVCKRYLTENINYDLDDQKKESIKTFFDYAYRIGALANNRNLVFI